MRRDPIAIVDYDSDWADGFERERQRLEAAFGSALTQPIEHIGSTSVPGLPSKPIIDMLAVVAEIDDVATEVPMVEALGWIAAPEPNDTTEHRMSFCFPSIEWRTFHLHVVEVRSPDWQGWLAFRDYLRTHHDVAVEYAELKRALAIEHGGDPNERDGYRVGKSEFISKVTAVAVGRRGGRE